MNYSQKVPKLLFLFFLLVGTASSYYNYNYSYNNKYKTKVQTNKPYYTSYDHTYGYSYSTAPSSTTSTVPPLRERIGITKPPDGPNIRPFPCKNRSSGQSGVCMFVWECGQANGTHIDVCQDGFYIGSCCQLNNRRNTSDYLQTNEIFRPQYLSTTSPTTTTPRMTISTTRRSTQHSRRTTARTTTTPRPTTTTTTTTTTARPTTTTTTTTTPRPTTTTTTTTTPRPTTTTTTTHRPTTTTTLPTTTTAESTTTTTTEITPVYSVSTSELPLMASSSFSPLNIFFPLFQLGSDDNKTVGFTTATQSTPVVLIDNSTSTTTEEPIVEPEAEPETQPEAEAEPSGTSSTTTNRPLSIFASLTSTTPNSLSVANKDYGLQDTDFFSENGSLLINNFRQICGRQFLPTSRIVGGIRAANGEWPWQVSVRIWSPVEKTFLHACGAVLLNENWAATAAHCLEKIDLDEIVLRLGDYDLSEDIGPYSYIERKVQLVIPHPKFMGMRKSFEYDLAMVRFYEPAVFQPNIVPICIPEKDETFEGKTGYVTGWGRLSEKGPIPAQLHEVQLPIISNAKCEAMFKAAGLDEYIPKIFMCASWPEGDKDACDGDSGSGLSILREEDKRWVLGGIVSWGHGCGVQNQPGVYTRVTEFRNWINLILSF